KTNNKKSFDVNERYWKSRFDQPVEPVNFYGQSSFVKSALTVRLSKIIDIDTASLLAEASRVESIPKIFTAVLFAYLNRVTLNSDLSIGVPLLNRTSSAFSSLGLYMEVCPNRITVDEGDTFGDVYNKVIEETKNVKPYRGHFVSAKKAGYEVVFNFQKFSSDEFCGLDAHYELTTPFNMTQEMVNDEPGSSWAGRESLAIQVNQKSVNDYEINFDFNLGVWGEPEFRKNAVEHFCTMLKCFLLDRTQKISEAEILTENEKVQLFSPEDSALLRCEKVPAVIDIFEEKVAENGDKFAVLFNDEGLSYTALNKKVNCLAAQLYDAGLRANMLVGVCLDRSPKVVVALLAVMKAGGAYVPIDPKQPAERIAIILEDSDPLLLITEKGLKDKVDVATENKLVICLDDNNYVAQEKNHSFERPAANDLAYVIFTSGSTGRPKGVEVKHHGLTTFLKAMANCPGMDSNDTILSVTTVSFDIAALELFLPLIVGATVRIAPYEATVSGDKLRALIEAKGVTMFQATPASYKLLVSSGWQGDSKLKLLCGGEAMPYELSKSLLNRCGSLWNMYGPTETTIWSSVYQVLASDNEISIGKPIDGTQMFVLNDSMQPVPIGVPGELYIAGDGVAGGYYKNKSLTKEKFVCNKFSLVPDYPMYKTGDLVRFRSDMNLQYLGRTDFQVKIRGFRVEIGEIEVISATHDLVKECVVNAWKDERDEQILVAYIVPIKSDEALDGLDLRDFLKGKLPDYMIPAFFIKLDGFPLTQNGKVDRKSLPLPTESEKITTQLEYVEPKNDFELCLSVAWQQVLKLPQVGVTDNFFDLGGDSLMTVMLIHEMELASGIKFDMGDVFSSPTIKQLVELHENGGNQVSTSTVPLQSKGDGLPLFCLCGIHIYKDLAISLGVDQPVYGVYVSQEQAFMNDVMNGREPELSVEDLAISYCEAIRRRQPNGPYRVAGISFGGLLAIEAARLLQSYGEEVSLVVLLDTILPEGIYRNLPSRFKRAVKDWLKKAKKATLQSFGASSNSSREDMVSSREEAFIKCMEEYGSEKGLYCGQVVLMKARDNSWGRGVTFTADYGWAKKIKGGLIVEDVVGDHLGIIKQPNVNDLAVLLRNHLDGKVAE
ncbi:MAG: amino acid adenylation domain-containing protein, partial [Cycloclasticus sp.]|nr:amino acid adenylation domain-containing protein [Cycloclasticus sp.]